MKRIRQKKICLSLIRVNPSIRVIRVSAFLLRRAEAGPEATADGRLLLRPQAVQKPADVTYRVWYTSVLAKIAVYGVVLQAARPRLVPGHPMVRQR